MNCESVRPRLGEWIVGALESEEASMIDTHVRDCRECAAETESLHDLEDRLTRLPRIVEPPAPTHRWAMRMPMLVAAATLMAVLGFLLWKGAPVAPGAQDGVAEAEWVRDGWKAVREELQRIAAAPGPVDSKLDEIFANLHGRLTRLRSRPAAADIADRLDRLRLSLELMGAPPKDLPRFQSRFPADEWRALTDILLPDTPPPQILAGHLEKRLRVADRLSSDLIERMKTIPDGPGEIPLPFWALDAEDINPMIRKRAQEELYRRAADWSEIDLAKLADSSPKWHARIACVRGNPAADHPAEAETIVQVGKDGAVRVEGEPLKDILELAGKLMPPAVAVYAHPDVAWEKVILVLTRTMDPKFESVRLAAQGQPLFARLGRSSEVPPVMEQPPKTTSQREIVLRMGNGKIQLGQSSWPEGDGTCPEGLSEILGGKRLAILVEAKPDVPAVRVLRLMSTTAKAHAGTLHVITGK